MSSQSTVYITGPMKRERTAEEGIATQVFFEQARDLIADIVWGDVEPTGDDSAELKGGEPIDRWVNRLNRPEQGPLSRETFRRTADVRSLAIRRLRALMGTNREINRALVLNTQLWINLLGVLAPQQNLRLSSLEFERMTWSDMLQLYNHSVRPETLTSALLMPLGPAIAQLIDDTELRGLLGARSPGEFEANVMRVVGTTLWHLLSVRRVEWRTALWLRGMAWDRWMAARFYLSDRPLDWLLLATTQLAQNLDPEDGSTLEYAESEQSFRGPEYDPRASYRLPYNYNHYGEYMSVREWLAPMKRLVALWQQSEQAREAHEVFVHRLRRDVQWSVMRLQQDDDQLTLVPRAELPMSYCVFWFALAYAGTDGHALYEEHRMFHACVGCAQPLRGECCWPRDTPTELYCSAECYAGDK